MTRPVFGGSERWLGSGPVPSNASAVPDCELWASIFGRDVSRVEQGGSPRLVWRKFPSDYRLLDHSDPDLLTEDFLSAGGDVHYGSLSDLQLEAGDAIANIWPKSYTYDYTVNLGRYFWRRIEAEKCQATARRRRAAALAELDAVRGVAVKEGYPVPSRSLVASVRGLLRRIADVAPLRYSVYPMEDGEIAIHASKEPTGAVAIICLPKDTWCVVSIGTSRRRAWFQNMDELPDPFTRKALEDLHGVDLHR